MSISPAGKRQGTNSLETDSNTSAPRFAMITHYKQKYIWKNLEKSQVSSHQNVMMRGTNGFKLGRFTFPMRQRLRRKLLSEWANESDDHVPRKDERYTDSATTVVAA